MMQSAEILPNFKIAQTLLYTVAEFENRRATNQHFIKRVMEQPKL
jgi:hypothetical protein